MEAHYKTYQPIFKQYSTSTTYPAENQKTEGDVFEPDVWEGIEETLFENGLSWRETLLSR